MQIRYGQMILTIELVTPDIAKEWLSFPGALNRALRPKRVDMYARDMHNGIWYDKPLAICFRENGSVGNGQHTLNAIIKSGCSQYLLIARNVSKETITIMDEALRRSITDIASLVGKDFSNRKVAITRAFLYGPYDKDPHSFDELYNGYSVHQEAIDFAFDHCPSRKAGASGSALAAIARAFYFARKENKYDRLLEFCEVLTTGMMNSPHDSSAVKLRDFLKDAALDSGGTKVRADTFFKTQSALYFFLNRKQMFQLKVNLQNLFPIPGDDWMLSLEVPKSDRHLVDKDKNKDQRLSI